MSTWADRITQHPIFPAISNAQASIESAAKNVKDPAAAAAIDRLRTIIGFLSVRMESTDPLLLYPPILDNFPPQLATLTQSVNNYVSDQSVSHLEQANAAADPMLGWLANVPIVLRKRELEGLRSSLQGLRKDADSIVSGLSSRVASAEASLASLSEEREKLAEQLRTIRSEVGAAMSDHQRQFSEAQDRRSTEAAQTTQDRERAARELLESQREKFVVALEASQEAASVSIEKMEAAFAGIESSIQAAGEKVIQEAQAKGALLTERLEGKSEEVDRLVGLIGARGVIGSYQKAATYFRKVGWFWNTVTVVALMMLAGSFLYLVSGEPTSPQSDGTSLKAALSHLPLFIALGALATYAGFEAAKAQRGEAENQKLELDLAALGPFLAGLDDSTLNEFRLKVADRVFGRPFDPESISASPATMTGALAKGVKIDRFALEVIDHVLKAVK